MICRKNWTACDRIDSGDVLRIRRSNNAVRGALPPGCPRLTTGLLPRPTRRCQRCQTCHAIAVASRCSSEERLATASLATGGGSSTCSLTGFARSRVYPPGNRGISTSRPWFTGWVPFRPACSGKGCVAASARRWKIQVGVHIPLINLTVFPAHSRRPRAVLTGKSDASPREKPANCRHRCERHMPPIL